MDIRIFLQCGNSCWSLSSTIMRWIRLRPSQFQPPLFRFVVVSGVTRLQWARVQVFQKGPLFPKKTFKKQRRANFGPPQRWARVHYTPCTPYCYATGSCTNPLQIEPVESEHHRNKPEREDTDGVESSWSTLVGRRLEDWIGVQVAPLKDSSRRHAHWWWWWPRRVIERERGVRVYVSFLVCTHARKQLTI